MKKLLSIVTAILFAATLFIVPTLSMAQPASGEKTAQTDQTVKKGKKKAKKSKAGKSTKGVKAKKGEEKKQE